MKKTSNWTEEQSFCFMMIFFGVNSNRGILPVLFCLFLFFFFQGRGEGLKHCFKARKGCAKETETKTDHSSLKVLKGGKHRELVSWQLHRVYKETPFCSANIRE